MDSVLDIDKSRELKELIEKITHTGSKKLDPDLFNYIVKVCNLGPIYVETAYKEVENFLKENHAEVRFSSVQLIDNLFVKYECFRNIVINELDVFVEYSTAIGTNKPLPPPKNVAAELMKLGLSCLDSWTKNFGREYRKLDSALHYLEQEYNVDFTTFEIVDKNERAKRIERYQRTLKINKELLKRTNNEMNDMKQELNSTLTSLESCFNLLLPSPEDFDLNDQEQSKKENSDDLRLYGVLNSHQGVMVQLDLGEKIKIKEDEENSAIIEAARDCFAIIKNRFLPKTEAWVELIKKAEGDKTLLESATTQKKKLEAALSKYTTLEIIPFGEVEDEVTSDSDLEEVALPPPNKKLAAKEEIEFLSHTLGVTKKPVRRGPSKTIEVTKEAGKSKKEDSNTDEKDRKSKLLEIAPVLPYDIDLYHWEDEKLPTPTLLSSNCEGASIWAAPASDIGEIPVPGGSEMLRSRVIEFSGKWEPVNRACKAPLPSGKLCPRHDRYKCPFHGLIVDRDDEGNIINKEDEQKVVKSRSQPPSVPDWQDPKLLAELKAKTGLDLKIPEKGKRMKNKKKYPGLTDIKTVKESSSTTRISKKIFSKASVKRVAATLDKLDYKRHRDKFGDQFNYVHNT